MRIHLLAAVAGIGLALAASANATTRVVTWTAKSYYGDPSGHSETITGTVTYGADSVVTDFTGTATGFVGGDPDWNGALMLSSSLSIPSISKTGDDKFVAGSGYDAGVDNQGLVLENTTGKQFIIYDLNGGQDFGGQIAGVFSSAGDGIYYANGIPEPATWSILTLGLAGLGGAMRRRRGVAPAAA